MKKNLTSEHAGRSMPVETPPGRAKRSAKLLARLGAPLLVLGLVLPARAEADEDPCNAWEVEYGLNANVKLTDTTMGAGNGTWPIGPGTAVVRYDNVNGQPGGAARLLTYRMRDHFTIKTSILLASASVTAESVTRTTPNACGISADGVLAGRSLTWKTPWNGVRSDGTLHCEGGLCGKFGAPPSGDSEVHIAPHQAQFKSFEFSEDHRTFTMDWSVSSHQDSPSQTSSVQLAGRETKRTCVVAKACP